MVKLFDSSLFVFTFISEWELDPETEDSKSTEEEVMKSEYDFESEFATVDNDDDTKRILKQLNNKKLFNRDRKIILLWIKNHTRVRYELLLDEKIFTEEEGEVDTMKM